MNVICASTAMRYISRAQSFKIPKLAKNIHIDLCMYIYIYIYIYHNYYSDKLNGGCLIFDYQLITVDAGPPLQELTNLSSKHIAQTV